MIPNMRESKEKNSPEKDAEKNKINCSQCGKEKYPKRLCRGHGGGGGGSGESKSGAENERTGIRSKPEEPLTAEASENTNTTFAGPFNELVLALRPSTKQNLKDIIHELIAKGLISIHQDRESQQLSIAFDPDLLSPTQLEVVRAVPTVIYHHWKQFCQENPHAGDMQIKQNKQGHIHIQFSTTPALYEAFIRRLSAVLLLSPAGLQHNHAPVDRKDPTIESGSSAQERRFNPSPFSMEPRPWRTKE